MAATSWRQLDRPLDREGSWHTQPSKTVPFRTADRSLMPARVSTQERPQQRQIARAPPTPAAPTDAAVPGVSRQRQRLPAVHPIKRSHCSTDVGPHPLSGLATADHHSAVRPGADDGRAITGHCGQTEQTCPEQRRRAEVPAGFTSEGWSGWRVRASCVAGEAGS